MAETREERAVEILARMVADILDATFAGRNASREDFKRSLDEYREWQRS